MAEKPPKSSTNESIDVDAEKNFGIEVGNAFPTQEILASQDKQVAMEVPSTALSEAIAKAKPLKERKKNGNGKKGDERSPKSVEVQTPPTAELSAIFGEKSIPRVVSQTWAKLKSEEKKKNYLETLRARHGTEDVSETIVSKKEKFDEYSVPTIDQMLKPDIPLEAGELSATSALDIDLSSESGASHIDLDIAPSVQNEVVQPARALKPRIKLKIKQFQQEIPTLTDVVEEGNALIDLEELNSITIDPKPTSMTEGTRLEWREKLRALITGAKEKVEWWKSSEEHLIRRNAELDAQGEKIGGFDGERLFRNMGEWYNKRSFYTKLAVGAGLGLGAAASAGASLPIAFACMSGIAAQRLAGFATMYMKFEKDSHQEKWGKEKAMLKAGAYTVLMGFTMKEAIEYASGTELAHTAQAKVDAWLGHMMEKIGTIADAAVGNYPNAGEIATAPSVLHTPEVAAADTVAGKLDGFSADVEVKAGQGYEHMAKQILKGMQDANPNIKPEDFPAGSDMHTLLGAKTPDEITKALDTLAKNNHFLNSDGTSARIDLHSHMTVGSDGQLLVNGEHYATTPSLHPTAPTPFPEASGVHATPEQVVPRPEAPVSAYDVTPAPDMSAAALDDKEINRQYDSVAETTDTYSEVPKPPAPEPAEVILQTPTEPPMIDVTHGSESITNHFGLKIPIAEPHIYADSGNQHLLAYGGSPQERAIAIQDYLRENPSKVVFAPDDSGEHRILWHLVDGKAVPGAAPIRTKGFFGLFSTFMKAPEPNELEKLIK